MEEFNHQFNGLTCELEQLYQQLGSGFHDEEEQWEIQQRIEEIQHQIRKAVDQDLDV